MPRLGNCDREREGARLRFAHASVSLLRYTFETMRTMKWQLIGEVMLVVHGTVPPASDDWAAYVAECKNAGEKVKYQLVFADISINAVQRRDVANVLKHCKSKL